MAGVLTGYTRDVWNFYPHLRLLNRFLLYLDARWFTRFMVSMPPQHGKSELISKYFQAWQIANHPDDRLLLASYEAGVANRWGRRVRELVKEYFKPLFNLELDPSKQAANEWELKGYRGSMSTAGSDGAFTGLPGDCVTIDDPHKGRKEARSKVIQQNVYEFYTDSADPRLSKKGIMALIQTRWDLFDLAGRIQKAEDCLTIEEALKVFQRNEILDNDEWVVLNLPAIAPKREILKLNGTTLWHRAKGAALCEDLHPLKQLTLKKGRTPHKSWLSEYMGTPIEDEGDMFHESWFKIKDEPPEDLIRMIRWWDLASKKKKEAMKSGGKYARTAGVLLGITEDRDLWCFDSKFFQKSPAGVRKKVVKTAESDRKRWGEWYDEPNIFWIRGGKDPGQASEDQELTYSRLLLGYNFKLIREVGSKEDRAENVAEHIEINNMYLLRGRWNKEFIEEHTLFPGGEWKDQVDATSGAYSQLTRIRKRATVYGGAR
ncbi:MAG: Terminase-like family protein [Candidatus Methanofastidiosum methylothiophilum]|uniref:Terminase-like family protein n=1 Tax=Candidatus Methanofastidiosum methylothiophilum TaxID=1705564 RepID=A0A150J9R8_9EURY|nr:MAG: Terminase-like family protein [Candidatus Methanofastidiosum methylthiophilus]